MGGGGGGCGGVTAKLQTACGCTDMGCETDKKKGRGGDGAQTHRGNRDRKRESKTASLRE